MRNAFASLLAVTAVGATSDVKAQETPVLYEIACAHSKLNVPEGLRCQTTQNYSGFQNSSDSNGNGTFRNWIARGAIDGVQYLYLMIEVTSMNMGLTPSATLQDTIKKEVSLSHPPTDFSVLSHRGGADFMTFKLANGSSCIGVRRCGPSESVGYRWIINAVRCEPFGRPLSESAIDGFIAGARTRNAR